MASNTILTPVQELAAGQVSAIRNAVIDAVVRKASGELSLDEEKLVVRDIRAYDDLGFGRNTDYMAEAPAVSLNVWGTFKSGDSYIGTHASNAGSFCDAIPDNTTMADDRYIAIYGVRDWRMSRPTIPANNVSLIKFNIGNADRVIWDLTKCEAYTNFIAGITPSAVLITPRAPYQISPYLIANDVEVCVQLMGVVVEPVGLLVTP